LAPRSRPQSRSQSRLGDLAPGEHGPADALDQPAARRDALAEGIPSKILAAGVVLGSIYLLFLLFSSPRFRVHRVTVDGTRLLSAADVEVASGVHGMSVFRVRTDLVAEQIVDQFGGASRARVTCQLPNRVTIAVEEHPAVLAWQSGELYWWVDTEGNVLGADETSGDLVVIRDLAGVNPEPEDRVVGVPWDLAQAVVDELPAVRSFDYTREAGLILHVTDSSWPVHLGHQGDARAKVELMKAIVPELSAQNARVGYIDLRSEGSPTVGWTP
jgi:cell division septal protein FtsQ